jgi:glucose/mannose transport system substrate-binding protein
MLADVSDDEFARDQVRDLDRASEQPQSIAHGLSVTTAQLVDLKSAIVEFVGTWDVDAVTGQLVETFDRV